MEIGLEFARKLIGAGKIKEISFHNPVHRPPLFRQAAGQGSSVDSTFARVFRRMSMCGGGFRRRDKAGKVGRIPKLGGPHACTRPVWPAIPA